MKTALARLATISVSLMVISLIFTGQGNTIDQKSFVARWLFDDVKGETAPDSSENGHDGKIKGAELVDGKKFGNALNFTGDDFLDCGMKDYDFGGAITVALWLKHIGGDYRGVINNGYWDAAGWEIRFGREDAGTRLGARINTDKGFFNVLDLHPSPNEWHHIALVYDGKTVNHYLDGSSGANGDLTGNIKKVANPVVIGHNGKGSEWYSGLIDEVAIFKVALTKEDIKTIMDKGLEHAGAVDLSGKLSTTWSTIKSH